MKSKFFFIFPVCFVALVMLMNPRANGQIVYVANLTGPNEFPSNNSPGTGFAQVTIDLALHTLTIHADFTNLQGTTTAAHIHAPTTDPFAGTASVATQTPLFSGFPTGVTSGSYDHVFDTLDAATWNASYVTANGGTAGGAEAAFAQALADGKAYFNIHTTAFTGGEIRGFLAVPEPGTVGLLAVGAVAGLLLRRRLRLK